MVSNIDDIILVRTQYVLVCTSLYYYTFPVPVCTWYVLVRTGSEPVRTKYPIPVMLFTIPEVLTIISYDIIVQIMISYSIVWYYIMLVIS